jgi:hypothetical protein
MSNYCCPPYQNDRLDCNKVLQCLDSLFAVLTPPDDIDGDTWANMPLNDKLQYILEHLAVDAVQPPTNTLPIEVYNLTTPQFTKVFTVGSILNSIVIDSPTPSDFSVNIGTTAFGSDIEEGFTFNGNQTPPVFTYSHYFRNAETWHFSGLPSTGKIIFVYNLLI